MSAEPKPEDVLDLTGQGSRHDSTPPKSQRKPNRDRARPGIAFAVLFLAIASTTISVNYSFLGNNGGSPSVPFDGATPQEPAARTTTEAHPAASNFTVTFGEGGLPTGTNWSVTFSGTKITSSSSRMNFSEPTGNYSYTVAPVPGFYSRPSSGYLLVQSHNASQGISFYPYTYVLTFSETGLPANTTWVIFLGTGYKYGSTQNVTFVEPNGSYSYSFSQPGSYVPTPSSGTVNLIGANATVYVNFVSNAPPSYSVTFSEIGLSAPTDWEVWLDGEVGESASSSLTLNESNGTYYYVAYTTYLADTTNWISNDSTGNVSVSGLNVSITVHFYAAPYTVAFVETGLPSPGIFEAAVDGLGRAGAGTTSFAEASGSYPFQVFPAYGMYPWPENGTVVVNGGDVTIAVNFGAQRSTVVFTESGLPAETNWSVDVNGSASSTNANSLTIALPNGTYSYSVPLISGFAPPASGTFSVSGSRVSVFVNFMRNTFLLTFRESGLPTGTAWGVVIGTETESGVSSNLSFLLPNGVYGFLIVGIPGYVYTAPTPAILNGAPAIVSVTFSLQSYPIVFVQFELPAGSNWSVNVANLTMGINRTQSSIGDSITFFLPNGTYTVRFDLPSGYLLNSTDSEFTVAGGGDHSVPISGPSPGPGSTQPPVSLTPGQHAVLAPSAATLAWIGLAIATATVLALLVSRRLRPPATLPPSDPRSPYHPYFQAVQESWKSPPKDGSL
jgi:hypothetical protein